jgi:SAM-dependent methyltransferase
MDLRNKLSAAGLATAARTLDYQPFVISDDTQTGAAHSWVYGDDPRTKPALVFHRGDYEPEEWSRITDTNSRLRAMYDDLLDEVAARFPGGSLLDVACNNGYFPVGAELRGMRGVGIDMADYGRAVSLLNEALGTKAKFVHAAYDSSTHTLPISQQFDVVVASAIMCHLPDPLNFLAALGKAARRAILFWGQVIDSDLMLVTYKAPHPDLSRLTTFPLGFNDNTRVSGGLFRQSMALMGFREVVELETKETWLPEFMPRSFDAAKPQSLQEELAKGSRHVAYLALR